jgi:signal transduction histidine kinase
VRAIAIVDALGPALDLGNGTASSELGPPRVVWTHAPLALSDGSSGTVWVAMSTQRLVRGALALFVGFGFLALGLAWLIRWIPLGTILLAEQRIQGLLSDLKSLNATLESRVAAAVQELRGNQRRLQELTSKTATLQEEERRRIARDLHDGLGQTLTGLRLRLQVLQQRSDLPPEAGKALADALSLTDESIDETRNAVQRLAPPLLAELGLAAALRRHCQGFAERTGLLVTCEVQGDMPHASAVEAACYRIAQEALTNVARHAQAESVSVRLDAAASGIHLEIRDDGCGFQPGGSPGRGLVGMRERAEVLGGTVALQTGPGQGVRVTVELPAETAA